MSTEPAVQHPAVQHPAVQHPAVQHPAVQHIVNVVVRGRDGRILMARYDATTEEDGTQASSGPIKWWLPAQELEPYQHPDEAAQQALDAIPGVDATISGLQRVQSFRGRRGWHLSFDYFAEAGGEPAGRGVPAAWHSLEDFPATMHGNWERETIDGVVAVVDS